MKMIWLMLAGILVFTSSIALAVDIFRFSGSNQNTDINLVELLYQVLPSNFTVGTPQFGENITIRADVTDSQDNVDWANFTLWGGTTNIAVIDNVNGTRAGDLWNSTVFNINESGKWTYRVQSGDNDTTNNTPNNFTNTFIVFDELTSVPNEIIETIPINFNLSYNVSVFTSTRKQLNFTLNHTFDGNFTVIINESTIYINGTQFSFFLLDIRSNASSENGYHNASINLIRHPPYNKTFNISAKIFISSNYGDIEFVSPSDYTFVACEGTIQHSMNVTNLGNFDMTDCRPFLYNSVGAEVGSGDNFTLDAGANAIASVLFGYDGNTNIDTWFAVECTASPNSSKDRTGLDPKIVFSPGSDCETSGTGGGSRSAPSVSPVREKVAAPTPTMPICGNNVCEADESPFQCAEDCIPELFNLEKTFCTPLFNCGNWEKQWFNNIMFFVVIGGMVFLTTRTTKTGRLK